MKIAIVGSRNFEPLSAVEDYVKSLPKDVVIVSGGARGVDKTAEHAAREYGLDTIVFIPLWDKYGKQAGFLRNIDIVEECDEVVAFWDSASRGTKHTIDLARKKNKKVTIYYASS